MGGSPMLSHYSSLIPRLHPTLGSETGNQTLPATYTPDIGKGVIQVEKVINAEISRLAVVKILQVKKDTTLSYINKTS